MITIPPPGSNPDTPSEMPGTPTSTTTSLSALSTTAIKDGQRGHFPQGPGFERGGHQHNSSTTSLEAERADRISRLAGLERVSTLRAPPSSAGGGAPSPSPSQTTPTSTGFPANYAPQHPVTPSYFDSNGQPVAVTKMSTVGTASATESHATESHAGDDARTTAAERDEDMLSTGTGYRGAGSVTSAGGDHYAMYEDMPPQNDDDRMSDDDGSASLVGFGEGAGSTVSGPIYHRRPAPGTAAHQAWVLERTNSGLSDPRRERDFAVTGDGSTSAALQERRDARLMDGIAADQHAQPGSNDGYVDTTVRGPVRDAENIVQQRLDHGESSAGPNAMSSADAQGQPLGKFYFEGQQRKE
ncbi:uncharacterized protein J7T54_001081 [Emericellopsis cladophorae]|uniref:Uncharacterized protein n=1 Tax=Emericellopsis cladophorae TaxID=2686198 RepID=A0A9P9Y060_9HYPO|nr:uncharacterized protein J7T54_001081 [Emericellopsis cladophorae]KAI6780773.1 hypothetical protein J7T54_001081 [Emericellopsis cladophorae]